MTQAASAAAVALRTPCAEQWANPRADTILYLLPKLFAVNGLPYLLIKNTILPTLAAAMLAARAECKGMSILIGLRCSFLVRRKQTRPSRIC